ncbi:MAG: L-rhamnose isomerase [bacterium]
MMKVGGDAVKILCDSLQARGVDLQTVKDKLKAQAIETPSWGYSDSGTRFGVFPQPWAAKTLEHKIQDAGTVHKYTGIAPSVAIHIPWDKVDDYEAMKDLASANGVRIGSVNPNVFQDEQYKLGSICHHDCGVRSAAIERHLECIDIMKKVDSTILSCWYADGTNYPGQGHFRRRKQWMQDTLAQVYQSLEPDMRMLVEYKLFEPGFYHTDLADWGMAYAICRHLGDRAQVLVDLGHHAHSVNIEHIVAFLIDEGKLGGFHFNNRKYADDDLTVGSVNPYEFFLIYNEMADAELDPSVEADIAYMVDQSHVIKPKIEAMIQTIVMIQETYARALIVDRKGLSEMQQAGDVVGAEEILVDAYRTDLRPLLEVIREEMGVSSDPLGAYRASGHNEKLAKERASLKSTGGLGT